MTSGIRLEDRERKRMWRRKKKYIYICALKKDQKCNIGWSVESV